MIQELHEACLQNAPNKWVSLSNPDGYRKNDAEKKEPDDYEPVAAWALLSFGTSGIFKNKKENPVEEEKNLENLNVPKRSI